MHPAPNRTLAVLAVASLGLLGLAACSSEPDAAPETSKVSASPSEAESSPAESSSAEAATGQPDWANKVTTGGKLISTIKAGGISVEVFQGDVTAATKTGQFVDPKTNKPIISVGDDITFVNYVVTNNGDSIDLGSSLVDVSARYDDWPYLQGMDSVVDDDLFAKQGVNADAFTPDAYRDPSVYPFAPAEQYSYGTNFRYQAKSPITFTVTVTPVDAKGDLLHDDRVEAEGTGTIG